LFQKIKNIGGRMNQTKITLLVINDGESFTDLEDLKSRKNYQELEEKINLPNDDLKIGNVIELENEKWITHNQIMVIDLKSDPMQIFVEEIQKFKKQTIIK